VQLLEGQYFLAYRAAYQLAVCHFAGAVVLACQQLPALSASDPMHLAASWHFPADMPAPAAQQLAVQSVATYLLHNIQVQLLPKYAL
jgi:hypothetical protein